MHTCINVTVMCMFALSICGNVYRLHFCTHCIIHHYVLGSEINLLFLFLQRQDILTWLPTQTFLKHPNMLKITQTNSVCVVQLSLS